MCSNIGFTNRETKAEGQNNLSEVPQLVRG